MNISELFTSKVLTISNLLSLLRIFLIPLFWLLLKESNIDPKYDFYVLAISMIMILTDFLDGFIARRLGQETPLGQYLDPIADKVVIISCLFMLWHYRGYPLWIIIFISIREILGVWLGIFLLVKRNTLGKPNYWGKAGVAFVALSATFYIMRWPYQEITEIAVVITFVGGLIAYGKRYWKTIFAL